MLCADCSRFTLKLAHCRHLILVIVIHIWQQLSSIECEVARIVTHFWQLFSEIFSETLLIVTHFWQSPTL